MSATATAASFKSAAGKPPFDTRKLDALMDKAGIDVLVASSKHNVQYLLGGYKFFFFETMDAAGISRYLPIVIYQKGKPERTHYVGCDNERFEQQNGKLWIESLDLGYTGTVTAATRAAEHIRKIGGVRRIGAELGFLPADADAVLRRSLGNVEIVDAALTLDRLRAVKTPQEISYLREASDRVVDAMQVVLARHCVAGARKHDVLEALKREEVERGLVFDYLLMTAGTNLNRAPETDYRLAKGDIINLDSGGNYKGYIGDLARMGIVDAKPDQELVDLLGWIDEVQQATRRLVKAGVRGGQVQETGHAMVERSPHAKYADFVAHGMGLVSHEAPRLLNNPRWSYSGEDIDAPLEAGMCLSVETTMRHPKRGFVKLEDTVLVTATGSEGLGDAARGWNVAGKG